MATHCNPAVYVEEAPAFAPAVAEVETAVPAFIGYTERARKLLTDDLRGIPTRIVSFADYERLYGGPLAPVIAVALVPSAAGYVATVTPPTLTHLLWYAVRMFFENGGRTCCIVSVGSYAQSIARADLAAGLKAVARHDEPTLLVCPEAVQLAGTGYDRIARSMLVQCGTLKDRFAILDLFGGGSTAPQDKATLAANRARVGNRHLRYGAMYYPFLRSRFNHFVLPDESNVEVTVGGSAPLKLAALGNRNAATLNIEAYRAAKAALLEHHVVVPPSGAVAGVYSATDNARGVWKAPANVGLAGVIEPVVRLDNARQDDLNVDAATGKSINAIRDFADRGTLVWGARSLAGNDNEWRYIPVRRFFNMVEESVRKSTSWAVFEPNDANTWIKVRRMIENYLTLKWREGALAGATTKDAFFVRCGLGATMTAQDILEGRMNVEIGMAAVRPSEFISLRFSHKLQTG
jgi:uncharacterized protein